MRAVLESVVTAEAKRWSSVDLGHLCDDFGYYCCQIGTGAYRDGDDLSRYRIKNGGIVAVVEVWRWLYGTDGVTTNGVCGLLMCVDCT